MMHKADFIIAKDFSPFPGPRYKNQGAHSGESLRAALKRKLSEKNYDEFWIDLDGTVGYGSSFLDEAFGGLVRERAFPRDWLKKNLRFISQTDPTYIREIMESIEQAKAAA